MTVSRQLELETFFLIAAVAGVSLFFVIQRNYQPQFSLATDNSPVRVPVEVIAPRSTMSSQISPDGKKKVVMKETQNFDDTKTYEFSTSDTNGANEKLIYTNKVDSSETMSIPFNTWSPDDKYFFIRKKSDTSESVYVFKATGEQIIEGSLYLDATDIFKQKDTGYNFDEATGWASETLIIINTKKADDSKGPSYWFEVPTKAIIQLSTEF